MFRLQQLKPLLIVALSILPLPAIAIDSAFVDKCFHTPFGLYLTPLEAWQMKQQDPDGVLFIDVRTRAEVQYVGFTEYADANIPVMFQPGSYEWNADKKDPKVGQFKKVRNEAFTKAVDKLVASRGLDKSAPVIVMCAAGKRSTAAARALHKAGYSRVYNLYEGFEGVMASDGYFRGQRVVNGWKNAALPWGYRLPSSKMYFNFQP
ncbi:MAG: rhodanese-like domain-containing protein [Sedimenticolaceae bacterium]|nr:rhodanese-like domain-containing protein [Sedimenticolaceae bacterium]